MNDVQEVRTKPQEEDRCVEEPAIIEEIQIEELAIDGICGVY